MKMVQDNNSFAVSSCLPHHVGNGWHKRLLTIWWKWLQQTAKEKATFIIPKFYRIWFCYFQNHGWFWYNKFKFGSRSISLRVQVPCIGGWGWGIEGWFGWTSYSDIKNALLLLENISRYTQPPYYIIFLKTVWKIKLRRTFPYFEMHRTILNWRKECLG